VAEFPQSLLKEFAGANRDITRSNIYRLLSSVDPALSEKGIGFGQFEQIARNPQVRSCMQQRIRAVTSRRLLVAPGSDHPDSAALAEFTRHQLEQVSSRTDLPGKSFDAICEKMLWGIFYGFSVAEAIWQREGNLTILADIRVRNRRRFTFDPLPKLITLENPTGETLPDRKFWWFCYGGDNDDNLAGCGLANWLYLPNLIQNQGLKFWLAFLERFGAPARLVKYPAGTSKEDQDALLEAAYALGSESAAVIPQEVVLELLETSKGSASYQEIFEQMNALISKIILSQTMTTDSGSSLSQSQVHLIVRQEVTDSDCDLLHDSLNSSLIRWLWEFNRGAFPNAEPPIVSRSLERSEDLNARAERDSKLYALGIRLKPAAVPEIYGQEYEIPLPLDAGDSSNLQFAEAGEVVDQFTEQLRDLANKDISAWIRQLRSKLNQAKDLQEFLAQIPDTYSELESAALEELVQEALTAARFAGIYEAEQEASG